MATITGIAAMMIDHLLVAILSDLPPEPVFAIAREWRIVPRALCVSRLHCTDNFGRHYLLAVELTAVHVEVKPTAEVGNTHENSTSRLHGLVSLFQPASDHLARIGPIGGNDIRSDDLELLRS